MPPDLQENPERERHRVGPRRPLKTPSSDQTRRSWESGRHGRHRPASPGGSRAHPTTRPGHTTADELRRQEAAAPSGAGEVPTEPISEETDESGGWKYTGSPGTKGQVKGKTRFSPKQKIIAALVTAAIGGGGLFGAAQLPNFVINQLRELLLGEVAELQNHHSLRYRRRRIHRIGDMFSREGRRGRKVIADMELHGYQFSFNRQTGAIQGLRPPGRTDFLIGPAIGDHISGYLEVRWPIRSSRWKTPGMETYDFFGRYGIRRTSVVERSDEPIDDPAVELNRRMAEQLIDQEIQTRAGGLDEGGEDESDEQRAAREQRNAEIEDLASSDGALDDLKAKLKDGVPLKDLTDDELLLLQVGIRNDQEIVDLMTRILNDQALSTRAFSSVKGFVNSTDILDKICTMKNLLQGIAFGARNIRKVVLLRYTGIFVSASDEIRKGGNPDPRLINVLFQRVMAVDGNGNAIGASPGFAYLLKRRFSQSRNDALSSNVRVDGVLTGLPGALQSSTNNIPGTSPGQCSVIQHPATQVTLIVVEVGISFLTGGGATAIRQGGKEAIEQALRQSLSRLISRQTAKSLARSAAVEITFGAAMMLLKVYSEKAMELNFSGQEQGGELGDIVTAGAGGLNEKRSGQAGMVPATTEEYSAAEEEFAMYKQEQLRKQNFFARTFDYNNHDSLVFKTASRLALMPWSVEGIGLGVRGALNKAASIITKPLSVLSGLANILSKKVGAQDANSDEVSFGEYQVDGGSADGTRLATDPAGNLLPVMRSDIADIDPIENIDFLTTSGDIDSETLRPESEDFIDHIENCVHAPDTLTTIETQDQSDPKYDCLASQPITVRYKAHLAYLDMLDNIDADLFPEEIVGSADSSLNFAMER